jgi:meiotic recombination protein REC8
MQIDETWGGVERNDMMELCNQPAGADTHNEEPNTRQPNEGSDGIEQPIEVPAVTTRRVRRPKEIISDDATALRNMTLAQWNNEYVTNMIQAAKQKQQNKFPTISKKNAAFWVFGQGVGSVGVGLGMDREAHPLSFYSGEKLFEAIGGYHGDGRKRKSDDDETSEERRVRARDERADHLSRENIDRLNREVEVGRDAPSSLFDDHSYQMPWNITASIQSSRQRQRVGSVSEMSSQGHKGRSRLTNASPLAGLSYLSGQDQLNLELGDFGEDLDLTRYLEGELATDREHISSLSPAKRSAIERVKATLDRESLNFIDFMKSKMGVLSNNKAGNTSQSPQRNLSSPVAGRVRQTTFASILPPESTTRAVATQALMNVLTLATKGVLHVHQEGYIDESTVEHGVRYRYGEIHLKLS